MYTGLNPLDLLNYPAEDVFNLIDETIDYKRRTKVKSSSSSKPDVIRRQASDDWF